MNHLANEQAYKGNAASLRYQAAIFDLDGTLLNTLGDLAAAVDHCLAPRGLPPVSEEQVRARVGNGIRLLCARSLPEGTTEEEIDAVHAEFGRFYMAHLYDRTLPYPGIVELLTTLHHAGVKIGVLSNKVDPAAKALTAHFFGTLVDHTLGERPDCPRKPDPTSAFALLKLLDASPATTLYVGDSGTDMETAKNAGLSSVGVTWGFRSRDVLLASGAQVLVDDASALLHVFTGDGA